MAHWVELYNKRRCPAEEAARIIQSGQRVFLTGNCSVPQVILAALVDYAESVRKYFIESTHTVIAGKLREQALEWRGKHAKDETFRADDAPMQKVQRWFAV